MPSERLPQMPTLDAFHTQISPLMPFGDFYPHVLTLLWKRGPGEISEKILRAFSTWP
jgi:hypothetical protein